MQCNVRSAVAGAAAGLLLTGPVTAAFVNFSTEASIQSDGKLVSQIYANFTSADETLISVTALQYLGGVGTTGMGVGNFYHRDLFNGLAYSVNAGTWNPQLTVTDGGGADSFVTVGGEPGPANTTFAVGWDGYNSTGLAPTTGWISWPITGQGLAGADHKVLVAQFVTDADKSWRIAATIFFTQGFGTPVGSASGEMSFGIPGPGVLAAMLLPLLGSNRRRGGKEM